MRCLQLHSNAFRAARACAKVNRPTVHPRKLTNCFSRSIHQRCVVVAAHASNPDEEARLRAALERQIKNSILKIESEQAAALRKRSEDEITETAKEVSDEIVKAVVANPDSSSVEVLRGLAARVPLLSDEQVLAAVQRQMQNASEPRKAPPARKYDAADVNIGFVAVNVPAPVEEAPPSEPVMSLDDADAAAPAQSEAPAQSAAPLMDEDQLKTALEFQLKRSLEAREAAESGEATEADLTAAAHALSEAIVEGVKAEPHHDSRRVLRELAKTVPMLSETQLLSAINRQLANSALAAEADLDPASSNGTSSQAEPEKSPYAPDKELDGYVVFTVEQLNAVCSKSLLERLLAPSVPQETA